MNTFNDVLKESKEAMGKYMDAFIEMAKLAPEIEKTDIDALQTLSTYIKEDCDLAPEVADGYSAVYNRVYDMIFTGNVKRIPYTEPNMGVYQYCTSYNIYDSHISRRDRKLLSLDFDTFEKATNFYNTIVDYLSKYGSITVKNVVDEYEKIYNTDDYTPNFYDYKCG